MPYNRATLRELITASLSSDDLNVFCFDHFPEVYNNFTDGQDKSERVFKLLDDVERRSNFKHLAELVKAANPRTFMEFEARLAEEVEPNVDPNKIDSRALRNAIITAFSVDEFALLCEDVEALMLENNITGELDLEIIGGSSKPRMVLNLIEHLKRRGQLKYLVQAVRTARPGII